MSDTEVKTETSNAAPAPDNGTSALELNTAPEGTIYTKEALQELVKNAAMEAINEYKKSIEAERSQIQNNSNTIGQMVQQTQANLITQSNMPMEQNERVNFINSVLNDHQELKYRYPGQSPAYLNDDLGLLKSKIVLLQRLGHSPEEIAKIL